MTRWSDDSFLDTLRQSTDESANAAVAQMIENDGIEAANRVFAVLHADDQQLPDDTPPSLRGFLRTTGELPSWAERARLDNAGQAFLQEASAGAFVMLASSLPQGYSAPCLTEILTISNNLETHPFKRLMGVIQLLVNIAQPNAWCDGGLATVTAQKLRLLHAGVRTLVPRHRPDFEARYGPPVNHEDMLATIMAFSWLVVQGLEKLGVPFEDKDDYYEMWRVFAVMMGIGPPDQPSSGEWVPANLDEAREFYESYARRQFTMPDENPAGPELAQENLNMMQHLIPKPLRKLGLKNGPKLAMTELLDDQALARIGIQPERGHALERKVLGELIKLTNHLSDDNPRIGRMLARLVFREMIHIGRGGDVTFVIPDSLESLRGSGLV